MNINLDQLNPEQLAKLYLLVLSFHLRDYAAEVYGAGIRNCGKIDFDEEIQKQVKP